jgi:pyrroloquinoline quinone biosynthesis protein B
MAHWPIGGKNGSLQFLSRQGPPVFYIHVNNTNPILHDDSAEQRAVAAAGITIAHDGLEVNL